MSDTTAPKTLPITVQPQEFEQIVGYLLEQPAKFAVPMLNYFQQEQAKAQQAAQSEPAAAPATPKPARKK